MPAIASQCAGRGVEGSKRVTDAGIVFQGVETGIDRERRPARVLEVVAELHALGIKRADIAERSVLVDAVHAQTHGAASAADEPAVRQIVAPFGTAAPAGPTPATPAKV